MNIQGGPAGEGVVASPPIDSAAWRGWQPGERESFFVAVARHRRAAWRVTAACALALVVLIVVVAVLMAPLFYGLLFIASDLVNLVVPTRDLFGPAVNAVDALVNHRQAVPPGRWVYVAAVTAAPALAWMALVTLALARVIHTSALFDRGDLSALGRVPDSSSLGEQRLRNVVQEMALAAGLPVPQILISPSPMPNAAVFGRDPEHATIVVAQGAVEILRRDELTGMAAQLIGAIANGDLAIGGRVAVIASLLGLVGRLSGSFSEREAWTPFVLLLRSIVRPDPRSARVLATMLTDPLGPSDRQEVAAARSKGYGNGADTGQDDAGNARARNSGSRSRWRDWLRMPFVGPLFLTGFMCGMVNAFLLTPIMALAWRQRKYMADASAVRLTRDPDTLSEALARLSQARGQYCVAPWLSHMAVMDPGRRDGGLMSASFVPMFPAVERRQRALVKLGAHLEAPPPRRWTWNPVTLVLVALAALCASLMATAVGLLVVLSAAMSGMFTIVPLAFLHVLLRWAADHV